MNRQTCAHRNKTQGGFITLLAVVILAFILALANAYLTAGSKEIDVAKTMLAASRARMASHAAVRLVAGALVFDATASGAPNVDHLSENWYLITEDVAGNKVPYQLDGANGVYFSTLIVDLSGRMKPNATNSAATTPMVDALPSWTAAAAPAVAADYWTNAEYGQLAGIANDRITGVTPYGRDHLININTADVKDDVAALDPPDIINALLKLNASSSGSANTYSRKLVRTRRGGLGNDNNAAFNPPLKDNNTTYPCTVLAGCWLTMSQSFTTPNPTSTTENAIENVAVTYGRITSEGFFLIKGVGWVVKDPTAGANSAKLAQYQVMRYIKRSATGYQDCASREWYLERRDLPVPPFAANDYDYEQTYFIIDSNF